MCLALSAAVLKRLDPSFAEAHAELCAHLLKVQQLDLAMRSRNEALRLEADLPTALLNRAVLHARAARMAEALQDLDRILRVEPGNGIAQFPDRFAA